MRKSRITKDQVKALLNVSRDLLKKVFNIVKMRKAIETPTRGTRSGITKEQAKAAKKAKHGIKVGKVTFK